MGGRLLLVVVRKAGGLMPTPEQRERAALDAAKKHLRAGRQSTALSILAIYAASLRGAK